MEPVEELLLRLAQEAAGDRAVVLAAGRTEEGELSLTFKEGSYTPSLIKETYELTKGEDGQLHTRRVVLDEPQYIVPQTIMEDIALKVMLANVDVKASVVHWKVAP